MSSVLHNSLISVTLDLMGGEEKARELLHKISECGEILNVSSIYKRYTSDAKNDLSARIEFVLRFETMMSVEQHLHLVLSLCDEGSSGLVQRSQVEMILLAYDDMILMSPRLTLPYPELHTDALIIRCAAEAWGQYEHPIYQKTLSEISKTARTARDAEFYKQGKSLIDF
ncbi:hypothetical protein [Bdellovibrio sp. KM01]|uniref:hypothetical protein n=1 Tax=Bdellovibrio sp. KM01 TaxID=2748865 RepID=UPI0015E9BD9C|nr:hypothetical protein [Bdellovibrio sp. KM01]QLY25525.1 hypothetical protein HW988_00220 [Bdellovibrio sp. KM01]